MWYLPGAGIELMSPELRGEFWSTIQPEKPSWCIFDEYVGKGELRIFLHFCHLDSILFYPFWINFCVWYKGNTEIRLIIFFVAKIGEALYSQQKTKPGADCGSDHELLIAKFRLKLKKVEKTTRPFRYDLNQIPYDYTVEVRNWFKGLDLIDRVPDEL